MGLKDLFGKNKRKIAKRRASKLLKNAKVYMARDKANGLLVHYNKAKDEYFTTNETIGACLWKDLDSCKAFCESVTNTDLEPVRFKPTSK